MKPEDIDREVRKVLEPLRVSPVTVSSQQEAQQTRDAMLPKLAAMIEGVPQQRQRLERQRLVRRVGRGAGVILAAAAAVALFWMGRSPEQKVASSEERAEQLILEGGQVTDNGRPLIVGSAYAIDQLGRLSTPKDRGAELAVGGLHIGFAAGSTADLAFSRSSRRIALNRGTVELDVPPLKHGATLSVTTPNAVVTVHGTRFSVQYAADNTCVRVREGVVSVMRGGGKRERLTVGQSSGCQLPTVKKVAAEAARQPLQEVVTSRTAPKPKSASGTLTQENALFRRALAAEQRGDLSKAETNLRRLLQRYPDSPLSGEAHRVLARVHAAWPSDSGSSGKRP